MTKDQAIRNPSIKELEDMRKKNMIEAEPIEEESNIGVDPIRPDEDMFAPKKYQHKLIFGNKESQKHIMDDGVVWIRRMTAVEQGMFHDIEDTLDNINFLRAINHTLENCIRSNIDIYELSLVEKIYLFLHILAITYGEKQVFTLICKECGSENKTKIDLIKDIPIKFMDKDYEYPKQFKIESYGTDITASIRYAKISEEFLFIESKTEWINKIQQLIVSIIGEKPDGNPITKEDWVPVIRNLDAKDVSKIEDALAELGNFGVDLRKFKKPFCGNKSCSLYHQPQEFELPIDQIFIKVFSS